MRILGWKSDCSFPKNSVSKSFAHYLICFELFAAFVKISSKACPRYSSLRLLQSELSPVFISLIAFPSFLFASGLYFDFYQFKYFVHAKTLNKIDYC
jgi:hypothetical protein